MRDVSVHDLLSELADAIEPQVRSKDITYRYVPCPRDDLMVYTDPERLTQLVLNLLSNAVKFTASGGRVTLAPAVSCSS